MIKLILTKPHLLNAVQQFWNLTCLTTNGGLFSFSNLHSADPRLTLDSCCRFSLQSSQKWSLVFREGSCDFKDPVCLPIAFIPFTDVLHCVSDEFLCFGDADADL